jgi:hypothetical protein
MGSAATAAARARPTQDDVVPLRGVRRRALEPPDHALELGVVEEVGSTTGRAHQMVPVAAAGLDQLVAAQALPHVERAHE